jgi:hypothetical protein
MILQKFCMSWLVANEDEVEADESGDRKARRVGVSQCEPDPI